MAKYCTRCNKSIYTAWRTLDDVKYYHPHCFTCAVCNVILECVQECGVHNLKEIYCKKCYKDILKGEKFSRWDQNPSSKSAGHVQSQCQGQGEQLAQFPPSHTQPPPLPVQVDNPNHKNNVEAHLQLPQSLQPAPLPLMTPPPPLIFDSPEFQLPPGHNTVPIPATQFAHVKQQLESLPPHQFQNRNMVVNVKEQKSCSSIPPLPPGASENHGQYFVHPAQEMFMIPPNHPHHPLKSSGQKVKVRKANSNSLQQQQQKVMEMDINNNPVPVKSKSRFLLRPASSTISKKMMEVAPILAQGAEYTFQEVSAKALSRSLKAKSKPSGSNIQSTNPLARYTQNQNQIHDHNHSHAHNHNHHHRSRSVGPGFVGSRNQRSSSMIQHPFQRGNISATVSRQGSKVVFPPKPSKSFSQSFPKYSAIEQRYAPQPHHQQRSPHTAVVPISKRQSIHNQNYNRQPRNPQVQVQMQGQGPTPRRTSEIYQQEQAYFKKAKIDVPSPQAILSAVRRERSNVSERPAQTVAVSKAVAGLQGHAHAHPHPPQENAFHRKTSSSRTGIALPKRNFNITFDCPICISSLVPGTSEGNNCNVKGCRGNVVTPCGHLFHRDCMENWLRIKGNKRCPICSAVCLQESLQPVFLECNVSAEVGGESKQVNRTHTASGNRSSTPAALPSYSTLKFENDQLKRKYNAMMQDKNNSNNLNVTIANSLQNAYDMECRNRLQLQWENKKLQQQVIELLQNNNHHNHNR